MSQERRNAVVFGHRAAHLLVPAKRADLTFTKAVTTPVAQAHLAWPVAQPDIAVRQLLTWSESFLVCSSTLR